MNNHYKDLQLSFLRFCSDFIAALDSVGTQFVNFDAAPDEDQLPNKDVLGPMSFMMSIDEHMIEGGIQIGISTYEDLNNFRLSNAMNELVKKLVPNSRLAVYNSDTGLVEGNMVIGSPVRVMPVINGKSRSLQFIALTFFTTRSYDLNSN